MLASYHKKPFGNGPSLPGKQIKGILDSISVPDSIKKNFSPLLEQRKSDITTQMDERLNGLRNSIIEGINGIKTSIIQSSNNPSKIYDKHIVLSDNIDQTELQKELEPVLMEFNN